MNNELELDEINWNHSDETVFAYSTNDDKTVFLFYDDFQFISYYLPY